MEKMIVNEELVNEFVNKSQDPIVELQFKSGVSRGTAFYFLRDKKAPKREKTMRRIASGIGADFSDLFKSSQAAS